MLRKRRKTMAEYESWELRLAWQEMLQLRGCPPDRVLHRKGETLPEVRRHLEICPFCADRLTESSPDRTASIAQLFVSDPLPSAAPESESDAAFPPLSEAAPGREPETREPPAQPGEVRSIRSSLGGWGPRSLYYNPPLVLVVSIPEAPWRGCNPGVVRVAQVHPAAPLAGPGDVEIAPGLFAEPWNTYPLRREDLGRVWEVVSGETLRAVVAAAEEARLRADTGPAARWIEAFRRLEIEVGAFFALQAVDALLPEEDASPWERLLAEFPDVAVLTAQLGRHQPRVILPESAPDIFQCLALARFPEDELPLAAAGVENRILLNRVVWTGRGIALSPLGAELTHWQAGPGGLTVGGVIETASPEGSELRAWLEVEAGPPLPAAEVDFDPAQGFFRARFPGVGGDEVSRGRLILLLGHPPEGEAPGDDGE